MKDFKHLFDKNLEINLTGNDNSINYKDSTNITSINTNNKNSNIFNLLLPSYNPRHYKDEKSSSLINKFLNKKEEFFEEHNEYNDNKISKLNSKYSTCNNYYPRKNYNKFLNSHQQTNSSILNNNIFQQNTTFEGLSGYNKLNTRDLIEITKKRKEIIEQKRLKEAEKKRIIESNLNNLDNFDIIVNKNASNSGQDDKNYCDEGVQTSLININYQENENNNKKDEPLSTIIFTDKSALINQEITFLSIQYSLKNTENNIEDSKEYKNIENDFVNIGCDTKESIHKDKDKDVMNNHMSKKNENKIINIKSTKNKKENTENNNIITNNKNENDSKTKDNNVNMNNNNIITKDNTNNNNNKDIKGEKKDNINNIINSKDNSDNNDNKDNIIKSKDNSDNNGNKDNNKEINKEELINNNINNNNNEQDIEFTIIDNTSITPPKNANEEDNYMTNGPDTFQIELNNSINESNHNNCDNNNIDSNTFTLINNNPKNMKEENEENKILKDSLEDSNDNNYKINDNIDKSQKSLSNSEENELTEIEEFDQNIILLQNESKTMSSHFDKLNKNKEGQEENISINNKDNILIEDKDIFNNDRNNDLNTSENNMDNISKTIDINKNDSLNNNNSSSSNNNNNTNNNNLSNNKENSNDIYSTHDDKCSYKENVFRSKGKKNNSLNKYNDYPTLRNLKDNNSLKSKIYNSNYTNNNRYNTKNHIFEEKDSNERLNLLKLKTSDLKLNNQEEEKIIMKPLKESSDNSNSNSHNNSNNCNIKPSISACNNTKNNFKNIKFSSHKKINSNINTNNTNISNNNNINSNSNSNNKNNISGIPIRPHKKKK